MICDGDYTVRYIELPVTVPGLTTMQDGHYNIYINACHSFECQSDALRHELAHIEHDDFAQEKPLEAVEPYRDKETKEKTVEAVAEPHREPEQPPMPTEPPPRRRRFFTADIYMTYEEARRMGRFKNRA